MKDSEGEHKIEVAQVRVKPCRVADAELSAVPERSPRARDVLLTYVDADVPHVAEVRDKLAGPASEVEDARSRPRPHVLAHERASAAGSADESRKEFVDLWSRQDAAEPRHGVRHNLRMVVGVARTDVSRVCLTSARSLMLPDPRDR
jgi:hypothetical protein